MMEQLLRLVARGGVQSYEDLMAHLSISRSMLEIMLEDLARLGYLRAVGNDCGGKCAACSVSGCSPTGPGNLWALTEKGSHAAARLST